jgi:biopolymer transport protein ExbD
MARKPSERRNYKDENMELDLTPMMNLIAILIPVLLVSTAFVELAVINVAAPAIGSSSDDKKPEDTPEKPPLNLTITITDQGYTLAGSGGVLGEPSSEKGPTIPVIEKSVSCGPYVGTWPPPRAKNRSLPRCENDNDTRTYWVYDNERLAKKLVEVKDAFPEERRVIIASEPEINYEAITDLMDASRNIKDAGGETRILFDEVVLSPGVS